MALAKGCPDLQFLNLSTCDKITNKAIEAVAVGCPALESLNVSKCSKLTKDSISLVARSCLKLRELHLHGCNRVDDSVLLEVGLHLPLLEALDVAGCPKISDEGLEAVSHGCTNLTFLNISSPWNKVTRGAIIEITERNPRLHSLAVSQVQSVDGALLRQVCANHQGLQHITISKCKNLSPNDIQDLRLKFAGMTFYV